MSGHGSGYGGGGGPDSGDDCGTLTFRTTLASPNPSALWKLQMNDALALELEGPNGPVHALTTDGDTAGSIVGPSVNKLVRCLGQGYSYVAVVRTVDAARCEVEVRAG
jgi:hypothetical protein